MTVTQRILHYLQSRELVASHQIEVELPMQLFAQNIVHNPGTYSRKFRMIREKAVEYGLSFETLKHGKENAWKVSITDQTKLDTALLTK